MLLLLLLLLLLLVVHILYAEGKGFLKVLVTSLLREIDRVCSRWGGGGERREGYPMYNVLQNETA